jgi:hypothetical protein
MRSFAVLRLLAVSVLAGATLVADWYSLTAKSGSGAGIKLSLVNPSGLDRLQYAWGMGNAGGAYVRIVNAATGLYVDGAGRTAGGSDGAEWSGSASRVEQQWIVENDGNYVRIKNRATGLYLDGESRTADGTALGQNNDTNATSQQWTVLTDANNVRVKNRATGKFIDGMGRTGDGAVLAQYSDSTSANQQWRITAAG